MLKALLLGLAIFAALATVQQGASPAYATFHCMRIAAVGGGGGGNANIQYVELRMNFGGQTLVGGHTIGFHDAAGSLEATFTFPSNVSTGTSGSSILIATQEFADNATVAPDFIFSAANTTGADVNHPIPAPAGKVSFADGSQNCQLGGPTVVDSVAYGSSYTGSVDYGSKFAADLPTAGTQALVVDNLNLEPADNSSEYSIQTVPFSVPPGATTPRNNAGATGSITPPTDTDGDGLSDDDEINIHGTDPNDPDTDNDGLNDGDEVNVHLTDPLDADTDNDTYNDGDEVFITTDPLDNCPDDPADNAWPSDMDNSGTANLLDLLPFKASFNTTTVDPSYNARVDLDASSSVDLLDLLPFKADFNTSCV